MDLPSNGIEVTSTRANVPEWQHANHPTYDNKVFTALEDIKDDLILVHGSENLIPPEEALDWLSQVQDYLREQIIAQYPKKINELDLPNFPRPGN